MRKQTNSNRIPFLLLGQLGLAQVAVVVIRRLRCMPDGWHVELALVLRSAAQSALATAADHLAGERVAEVLQVRRVEQSHIPLLRELGELALQLVGHVLRTDVAEVGALLFAVELDHTIVGHLERSIGLDEEQEDREDDGC